MKIIPINRDDALKYWPVLTPYFEKAMVHGQGESTLADYMSKILTHRAQCWVLLNEQGQIVGAAVTEFIQYMQHKTLHILAYGGGDFEEQSKVFPTVIEYAKANGCKAIEQWGRDGWAKVLPKYVPGFKKAYTVMVMDLGDTNNETK